MGKDAILADRRGLSDGLVGEGGLHLPDGEAVQAAKMVNVILHVVQFDRVSGYSLQTDFSAEHRASLNVKIELATEMPPGSVFTQHGAIFTIVRPG